MIQNPGDRVDIELAEPDAGGERTPRELLAGELLLYALAEALAPRP